MLFLKVKNSYMFPLAKVAIIMLNMKKIERFAVAVNGLKSETYKGDI
jgi:hypothetical protein